nr:hypothetical protein [Streptomyces sioyaensis]
MPVQTWVAVARPATTGVVTVGVPSPKSKVTVPVGVPSPGGAAETVAVTVTGWPVTDGSGDEATTVPDCAWSTVCVAVPPEAVKSVSPP